MMDLFLNDILDHKIPIEDVRKWIINPKDATEEIQKLHCDPTDFSFFVLSFLRDQTTSILSSKIPETQVSVEKTCQRKASNEKGKQKKCNTKTPSPSQQKQPSPSTNHRQVSPITLGNFIITKQKPKKTRHEPIKIGCQQPTRRINPIQCEPIQKTTSSAFNVAEVNYNDFHSEEISRKSSENNTFPVLEKLSISPENGSKNEVTFKKQLDILSKLYNLILDNNLALNIMSELYFLIELLLITNCGDMASSSVLNSKQNCSYFAAKTLNRQQKLLQFLDSPTVRILIENVSLKQHAPELVTFLQDFKPLINNNVTLNLNVVAYPTENEEKQNFSNSDAYLVFRKQRDAFYYILEMWDHERYFTDRLVKNVQTIFKQKYEPEFFMHFSHLFVSQLIASCIGVKEKSNVLDLQVDPVRLKRLHERLVNPSRSCGGPCPVSEFQGWEEFFRDFIELSDSLQFRLHLNNSLISRILELNSQQFLPSDLQESGTYVEEETVAKFVGCVLSVQLLAKFLGHLVFGPYLPSPSVTMPEHVIALQSAVRLEIQPSLDVCSVLTNAESQGRLVMTVPWMCSYIAHLDPASLRLPHYTRLLRHLISIQRGLSHRAHMSPATVVLLRFCIGWMLNVLAENNPCVWDMARLGIVSHEEILSDVTSLDYLDLIDSRALFSLCPFLSELRVRLSTLGTTNSRPCVGPRHITPVATLNSSHQLEFQLESSFLQTQPSFVRRTLDFVAERVSHSCTKHLLAGTLAQLTLRLRQVCMNQVKVEEVKHQEIKTEFFEFVAAVKGSLVKWSEELAVNEFSQVQDVCKAQVQEFCQHHCTESLTHLLSLNSATESQMLATIGTRNASNKVHSWLRARVSVDEMKKQVLNEIERAARAVGKLETAPKSDPRYSNRLPPGGCSVNHNDLSPCPADVLVTIRELIRDLLIGNKTDRQSTTQVFNDVEAVIKDRADVIPSAQTALQELSLDLLFILVCKQPHLVDKTLITKLVSMWSGPVGRPQSMDRILSARNLHQLERAPSKAWEVLQCLLLQLVQSKLLSLDSLEEQMVAVMREQWTEAFLLHYSRCVQDLVHQLKSSIPAEQLNRFSQFLMWLSEFCIDLDQDYF